MNGADSVIRGGDLDRIRRIRRRFGFGERLDALLGVVQCLLARAGQIHSTFEELQGFFETGLAVFHPFDDRFEFLQRVLERRAIPFDFPRHGLVTGDAPKLQQRLASGQFDTNAALVQCRERRSRKERDPLLRRRADDRGNLSPNAFGSGRNRIRIDLRATYIDTLPARG